MALGAAGISHFNNLAVFFVLQGGPSKLASVLTSLEEKGKVKSPKSKSPPRSKSPKVEEKKVKKDDEARKKESVKVILGCCLISACACLSPCFYFFSFLFAFDRAM